MTKRLTLILSLFLLVSTLKGLCCTEQLKVDFVVRLDDSTLSHPSSCSLKGMKLLSSDNFLVFGNDGENRFWLSKLDVSGKLLSTWIYRGEKQFELEDVVVSENGDMYVIGSIYECHFFTTLSKILSDGSVSFTKKIGSNAMVHSVHSTSDGNIVVAGTSDANSLKDFQYDAWILKIDFSGKVIWEKFHDLGFDDTVVDVVEKDNGTLLLAVNCCTAPLEFQESAVLHIDSQGKIGLVLKNEQKTEMKSVQLTQDTLCILYSHFVELGLMDISAVSSVLYGYDANYMKKWTTQLGAYSQVVCQAMVSMDDGSVIVAGITDGITLKLDRIRLDGKQKFSRRVAIGVDEPPEDDTEWESSFDLINVSEVAIVGSALYIVYKKDTTQMTFTEDLKACTTTSHIGLIKVDSESGTDMWRREFLHSKEDTRSYP